MELGKHQKRQTKLTSEPSAVKRQRQQRLTHTPAHTHSNICEGARSVQPETAQGSSGAGWWTSVEQTGCRPHCKSDPGIKLRRSPSSRQQRLSEERKFSERAEPEQDAHGADMG